MSISEMVSKVVRFYLKRDLTQNESTIRLGQLGEFRLLCSQYSLNLAIQDYQFGA